MVVRRKECSVICAREHAIETGLEREKLENEHENLVKLINELRAILADEKLLLGVIKKEIIEISNIRTYEKDGKEGKVASLTLQDATGEIEYTLWRNNAELLKNIKSKEINNYIYDILTKQYETIINEIEDTNNYNRLLNEKESKQTTLSEIENENNSDKFQNVLGELLEQERKKQEEIEKEKERILEEERQRKLLIERKKQEEILKKQKIIEEARKKEMEKRTKEMLEQQQKSFIQPKKEEEKPKIEVSSPIIQEEINEPLEDNLPRRFKEEPVEEQPEDFPLFKNKVDIEKELFEEFNEEKNETPKEEPIEESNKFPDMSIDEYMNNFNEKSVNDDKLEDLFADDDLFPSIPV